MRLAPRRYVRCRECESDYRLRVFSHKDAPGLQVRQIRAGRGLGNRGWEAVLLAPCGRNRMVKLNILVLGKTSREDVVEAALQTADGLWRSV